MQVIERRDIRLKTSEGNFVFTEVRSSYPGGQEVITFRYDGPRRSGASSQRKGQTLEMYVDEIRQSL